MPQSSELKTLGYGYQDEAEKAIANGQLEDAIALYRKAIQVFEQIDDPKGTTEALAKLGVLYALSGEDDLAIDNYLLALNHAIKNNYTFTQARIYNNIGNELLMIHDYKSAKNLFLKGVMMMDRDESKQHPNYNRLLIVLYLNFVNCNIELHQFKDAEKYLQLCKDQVKSSGLDEYHYPTLVYELRLRWEVNDRQFVYDHIDEIIDHFTNDVKDQDFIQHVEQMCTVCRAMGDMDRWQTVLECFENYAEQQDRPYFYMMNADLWTVYHRSLGDSQSAQYTALEYYDYAHHYREENEKKRSHEIRGKVEFSVLQTAQQEASLLNHLDPLTGVGDQKKLAQDYQRLLNEVCLSHGTLAFGIIDIDNFHLINEEKGYLEGDNVLKQVAGILTNIIMEYGLVYRMNGGKFSVLLADCNESILQLIADNVKKALPHSVCQGFAYMTPSLDQGLEQYITHAKRSLHLAKEQGNGSIVILETSIKDYHKFYEAYRNNMESSAVLEQDFRNAEDHEQWIMNIMQRRVHNQSLMKENQKLIDRYLTPILDGTEELTEESALSLAKEIWAMREAGYMENLVMLEVAKVVEAFLEQSLYPEEHIYMLIVLGEAYGSMNSTEYFSKAYSYYTKLNVYRGYLHQISKRSLRRTLYEAFLKGGVTLAENGSSSLQKILSNIHKELDYYHDENIKDVLRLTDEETSDMVGGFIVQSIAGALIRTHKVDPENEDYIDAHGLVSTQYRRALMAAETEFDIDDRLHAVYIHLNWLLGRITSEECYRAHKDYFDYNKDRVDVSEQSNALETTLAFRMIVFHIPELLYLSNYLEGAAAKEEKGYIDSLVETYIEYMSTLPKGGKETGLTKELYHSLARMLTYLPARVDSFDLLFKAIIERNVEHSIHSKMVSEICKLMVEMIYRNQPAILIGTMGYVDEDDVLSGQEEITRFMQNAGLIHDIGKIEINDIINQQIRKLTDLELDNVRKHPEYGVNMVRNAESLRAYIPMILGHHRYYDDQNGYPERYFYRDNPEPLLVSIIQLADSLDAATDGICRNYSKPKSLKEVIVEFKAEKDTRYNPVLVEMMDNDRTFKRELDQLVNEGREDICFEIFKSYDSV